MNFAIIIVLLVTAVIPEVWTKDKIVVGGLFHGDDEISQIAFKYAIDRVNQAPSQILLQVKMFNISRTDSFKAQQIVCELAAEGVDIIFGPSSVETSGIVSSIASKFGIPHLIFHWKTNSLNWEKMMPDEDEMTLNVYPQSETLSEAFAHVLADYTWKSYAVVYENKENLIRLKDILQIHSPSSDAIMLRQLDQASNSFELDNKLGSLLKEIRNRGEVNVVLDISIEKIIPFLQAAANVNMLGDYNNYFITNLDTHTLNLNQIPNLKSNVTCLRLINPDSIELENAIRTWRQKEKIDLIKKQVPIEAGLVHDAVQILNNGLKLFDGEIFGSRRNQKNRHSCSNPEKNSQSSAGFGLINLMKKQEVDGITGIVQFDEDESSRTNFKLEILEFANGDFSKIGYWSTDHKVKYDREEGPSDNKTYEMIKNKRFKIVSKTGEPFLMVKKQEEGTIFEGNARFEGYVVDLINKMQVGLGFKYELEVVPDNKYGSLDPATKKWDGLVRYLLDRKADLAVADMTISYERKTAIDFTMPFMNLGIGIMHTKPPKKETNLFSFLDPFTVDVWLYTGLAYLSISVLVFLLSRINNDDWESSHPCNQEAEEVESIWSILNCVWLGMGSIMGQGCDILPKGSSTRIVTGTWWFFALIMLASYTANLAAFLTADRMGSTINGAEDLAKQTKVKYGAVIGGSTIRFFQESNFSTYQRMWATMETAGDSVQNKDNSEGVARVKKENGNYAFLMESVPMEYQTNRECTLQQVGELLDSKGYGIALPINSPYRKAFSEEILKLSESGALNELKTKWWVQPNITCDDDKPHDDLGIGNVGGVFLVLAGGCLVAFVFALFEFLWNVEKIAIDEKIAPWDAFKSEISFAFNILITSKPVRSKSSEMVSRKSTPPRSLKSRSRYGSETRSLKNKSTRSLNLDNGMHDSNSRSLLNLH